MEDGTRVRIVKHVTLYGMSLKGRRATVVDAGTKYATIVIDVVDWRVRVPLDALERSAPE